MRTLFYLLFLAQVSSIYSGVSFTCARQALDVNIDEKEKNITIKLEVFDYSKKEYVETPVALDENFIAVFDRDETLTHSAGSTRKVNTGLSEVLIGLKKLNINTFVLSAANYDTRMHSNLLNIFPNFFENNIDDKINEKIHPQAKGSYAKDGIIYASYYGFKEEVSSVNKELFLHSLTEVTKKKRVIFFDNDFYFCKKVESEFNKHNRDYECQIIWIPEMQKLNNIITNSINSDLNLKMLEAEREKYYSPLLENSENYPIRRGVDETTKLVFSGQQPSQKGDFVKASSSCGAMSFSVISVLSLSAIISTAVLYYLKYLKEKKQPCKNQAQSKDQSIKLRRLSKI